MTREKIEKQADNYASKAIPSYVNGSFDKHAIAQAFEEGVYWVLNELNEEINYDNSSS